MSEAKADFIASITAYSITGEQIKKKILNTACEDTPYYNSKITEKSLATTPHMIVLVWTKYWLQIAEKIYLAITAIVQKSH